MVTSLDRIFKREHFYTSSGSKTRPLYKIKYNSRGVSELVADGEENVYELIQSSKDSVDINVILKKYANGDLSVLNRNKPIYIDTTALPRNAAEWFQLCQDGKDYFYSLPADVRSKFNNSVEQFLANFDGNLESLINATDDLAIDEKESEVSSDES